MDFLLPDTEVFVQKKALETAAPHQVQAVVEEDMFQIGFALVALHRQTAQSGEGPHRIIAVEQVFVDDHEGAGPCGALLAHQLLEFGFLEGVGKELVPHQILIVNHEVS